MQLRRPSPSLVVSIIALVVALSSTAYAAVRITSSSQIKNGAVTGADVRNGSLRGADLAKGTITSTRLSSGVRRQLGGKATTRQAQAGATAYEAVRRVGPENQPSGQLITVATLALPAGAYAITSKTIMTPILPNRNLLFEILDPRASATGECTLDAAGDADKGRASIVVSTVPAPSTIYTQITRTIGSSGTVTLRCGSSVPWSTSDTSIIATEVGSVSRTG